MRRPTTVELMLSTTILLWALNLSVTKYILTHGFLPLPYATVRYGARRADLRRAHALRASGRFASSAGICRSSLSLRAPSG